MPALTRILKALSNPNRRRIYQIICRKGAGRTRDLTIDEIRRRSGLKQAAVSLHVKRLAAAGLVLRRKTGWYVHCAPAPGGLAALLRFARDPAGFPPA